jgi:hypothetical protein
MGSSEINLETDDAYHEDSFPSHVHGAAVGLSELYYSVLLCTPMKFMTPAGCCFFFFCLSKLITGGESRSRPILLRIPHE